MKSIWQGESSGHKKAPLQERLALRDASLNNPDLKAVSPEITLRFTICYKV